MECKFCGIVTDDSHESQEACIAALHAEIDRMKAVVDCLRSAAVPMPVDAAVHPAIRPPAFRGDEERQF